MRRSCRKKAPVNVLVSMAGEGAVLIDANEDVYMAPAPKGTLVNARGRRRFYGGRIYGRMAGKAEITNMHSVWVCLQEAPAHFLNIWQQRHEIEAVYQNR